MTADGKVHSFGNCGDGRLGNGTKVGKQSTPAGLPGLCLLRTAASSRAGGGAEEGSPSRKRKRTESSGGGDGC